MKKNSGIIFLLLSFAGMLAVFLWMRVQGAPLKTTGTPLAILDLEFAWNLARGEKVLSAWSGQLLDVARINIYIDFLFIIGYSAFLNLACNALAAKHTGGWQTAGLKIGRLMPIAGIFDIAENALMLLSLQATPNNNTAMATTAFALFKFALVLAGIGYLLVGGAARLFRR